MQASSGQRPDKISNAQIKKIWSMSKAMGISKENLYVMLDSIAPDARKKDDGTPSLSSIRYGQAWKLIDSLHRKHLTPPRISKTSGVRTLITPGQKAYIQDLCELVSEGREFPIEPDRFCLRNYKTTYEKLTRFQAQSFIEALKAILEREGKLGS